jgi:MFS transporter, OFA family, oxalate/formate antiporter
VPGVATGAANGMVFDAAALRLALTLRGITNRLTRPFSGRGSHKIGRENTLFVAFTLEAVAVFLVTNERHNAMLFLLMSGVVAFGWSE